MTDDVFILISQRKLRAAINRLHEYARLYPEVEAVERVERISADYDRMLDYMERGFKDEQREQFYNDLLLKTYRLEADTQLADKCRRSSFLTEALRQAARANYDDALIRYTLENFVSEVAMLSLEQPSGDEARKELKKRRRAIYSRHEEFMSLLFRKVWLSTQWTDNTAAFFESLLLSPTVDVNDVLLLESAVMLGCSMQFDYLKWRTLVSVFRQTTDTRVCQRALVGWVLALKHGPQTSLYDQQIEQLVGEVCADEGVRRQLLELQMQLFHCLNAERDHQKLQQDLYPNLLKNNNLRITRFGIEEIEDDPMKDILDPGAADRAMEEMEQSMKRMMEMQQQGSDIYFGGFSVMKQFPFFNDVSHWLTPFFEDNPALNKVTDRLADTHLLQNLVDNGPFCDSDKYSFSIAISRVIDHLPPNVREMMGTADALGPIAPREELSTPAYIRRLYLQDLYRFHRLFPSKADFVNPFDILYTPSAAGSVKPATPPAASEQTAVIRSFFFALPPFRKAGLKAQVGELGTFLLKHGRMGELRLLLNAYVGSDPSASADTLLLLLSAKSCEYFKQPGATKFYQRVLAVEPDNEVARRSMGQYYFAHEQYAEAQQCYSRLYELHPGKKSYMMSLAVALLYQGRTDEAMPLVYQLAYEHPDDLNVKRTQAWGLMAQQKLQQAQEAYRQILQNPKAEDYLNAGYCEWFMGNIQEAKQMFASYKNLSSEKLSDHFRRDSATLLSHGITQMDMILMADLLEPQA